jgi:bacterial/archaeal transporter family protein
MHIATWFWFVVIAMATWGITGLFQKLSTNHISAESTLILLIAGFLLLAPLVYPGSAVLQYSRWNLLWGLLSGLMNALGSWALFAAMKDGGKASIVSTLTSLYPLVVVLLAPFILRETITPLQIAGIICSLLAAVLFSLPHESDRG